MENRPFSISGALREGWELTKANIGFLISYQIILFFVMWLFRDSQKEWRISLIHIVGVFIVILGKMGFYNSALLLTKGLKPRFNQFYKNWRLLFAWIVAGFLFGAMFLTGLLFLIFPGMYIWAAFGLFPYFILDKALGPIEALKQAFAATKDIRWPVFLLLIACAGIDLLGLIFFGVGLLIAAPLTTIATAVVYRKLTGQATTSIQPDDLI